MKFEKFYLDNDILRNLDGLGFKRTTDIQFKAIPAILRGEDVLAIAQTGTGKTAAFAIPLIHLIHKNKVSKRSPGVKCIVMVPTRELAQQIGEVFYKISKNTKVKAYAVYGGVEEDPQIKKLQDGIDILIATPGRMFDFIRQGILRLNSIEFLVLDEADRMLDLGFNKDVVQVKKNLVRPHQTLFFSATINPQIKKLAYSQVKHQAIRIEISPEDPISKNVTHFVMPVEMDDKRFFLAEYLRQHPENKFIIFVRTKLRAERVHKALEKMGITALTIHGDKDQKDRTQTMINFKNNKFKILIATDINARGIDIPDITHVINYDLPEKPENYVHRIGRTGRGFNKGQAISFCSTEEKPLLKSIEDFINKPIELITVNKADYKFIIESKGKEPSLLELVELGDKKSPKELKRLKWKSLKK